MKKEDFLKVMEELYTIGCSDKHSALISYDTTRSAYGCEWEPRIHISIIKRRHDIQPCEVCENKYIEELDAETLAFIDKWRQIIAAENE